MSKPPKKGPKPRPNKTVVARKPTSADFDEVLNLIESARTRAVAAVNTALIDLYWSIGEHICGRVAADGWGKGIVENLAEYIRKRQPNARGFSASNLWRMMQFFETYRGLPKLATLLRELSWSHNLAIMSRSKRDEEREFYLRMATQQRWSFRELQRQLNGALFERVVLSPVIVSPPLTQLHPDATAIFKDTYLLDFLDLPAAGRMAGSSGFQPERVITQVGNLSYKTENRRQEVVEYALSRTVSPALVAEYQSHLPDKKFLQAKLHEFYELAQSQTAIEDKPRKTRKK